MPDKKLHACLYARMQQRKLVPSRVPSSSRSAADLKRATVDKAAAFIDSSSKHWSHP